MLGIHPPGVTVPCSIGSQPVAERLSGPWRSILPLSVHFEAVEAAWREGTLSEGPPDRLLLSSVALACRVGALTQLGPEKCCLVPAGAPASD